MNSSNSGPFNSLADFIPVAKSIVASGRELDEANTKAKLITPLLRTLGWDILDNSEVLLEYSEGGTFDKYADYALLNDGEVHAVVEAKQIGRPLKDDGQIRQYMRLFDADWGMLTNGEKYQFFESDNDTGETHVNSVSLDNLAQCNALQPYDRHYQIETESSHQKYQDDLSELSDNTKREIVELSHKRNLYEQLVDSIAPSVYGNEKEKLALLLSLAGGVAKSSETGRPVRDAIDILFLHDPSTYGDRLVKSAANLAPDGVHISGNPSGNSLTKQQDFEFYTTEYPPITSATRPQPPSHIILTGQEKLSTGQIESIYEAFDTDSSGTTDHVQWQNKTGLIVAGKPEYGRFDQYEPIDDQINLDGSLISEFDLIFIITDQIDEQQDTNRAEHHLKTNYGGEVKANQQQSDSGVTSEEVSTVADEFKPAIGPELLRKYIAYAKRNCSPVMTDEAKSTIRDFYVNVRSEGEDEDAPVPIAAKKIDTLVRLSEASARLRLSNTIDEEDADRAVDVAHYSLKGIGVAIEVGEFSQAVAEPDTPEEDRDRRANIRGIIGDIEDQYEKGAPVEVVVKRAEDSGIAETKAEYDIDRLKDKGEVYEPRTGHLRTT